MQKIVEEVTKIVNWYKDLPKDYSNIEDIMYARQKICGNMFMLYVELGKIRQEWKEYEFTTESVRRKTMAQMLDDGMSVAKADAYSRVESLEYLDQEKQIESQFHALKFMVDSAQDVNQTMMQHISTLKKERENSPQYT